MRNTFLPFSRPHISSGDIEAVVKVLQSGWITTGSYCEKFEKNFSTFCGSDGAVALASATAGMHLVLKYLGIGPGDEVITPSMTWVSTVNLITLAGARPVFVDIDKDTLMTGIDQIKTAVTERTKLVIPVHFAGAAVDMEPIRNFCTSSGIHLVEDAAHGAGTTCHGNQVGSVGTSVFSFHPSKNMTTGEGGMVVSDDADLLNGIRRLKFHGLGVDAYDRKQKGRSPQAEVLEPGFKYNLTDISAALGLGQLQRLDENIKKRKGLVEYYLEKLTGIPEIQPLSVPEMPHGHSWHLMVIRLDIDSAKMSRYDFMAALQEENIGTGLHFKAVHTQKYYREQVDFPVPQLPNTEWNSDRIVSLPLFPDMQKNDVDDVITAIKKVLS
jgi:UDP-4-amino-4-deoxy-L-arabinose-oxoglutarate aminotransferase